MIAVEQLDHIALTVADPAAAAKWYQAVLGLERRHQDVWGDCPIMLCAGNSGVALFPARTTGSSETADNSGASAVRHFAFRTDWSNFQKAQQELQCMRIPFQLEDHQIAQSIYFKDPDGHQLEITTYDARAFAKIEPAAK